MTAEELLTAGELASRLRVRPETIRRWSAAGLIPRLVISPKAIRYDWQAVQVVLAERAAAERQEVIRG